jgi:CRP-like cAMP-binding protein
MLDLNKLHNQLREISTLVEVPLDEDFDFNIAGEAFVIESGSLLAYGDIDPDTGVRETQTFSVGDPIGFAEAIASREKSFHFRKLSDLTLRKFKSAELRRQVNASNVLSRTIIRYSIARIFGHKKSTTNFQFEDKFIDTNQEFLSRLYLAEGETIFSVNTKPRAIFFIEKGSVGIISENRNQLAVLSNGECFGESALIHNRLHSHSAIANTNLNLLLIDGERVKKELDLDQPLVQYAVFVLLKRLALMNKLRGVT